MGGGGSDGDGYSDWAVLPCPPRLADVSLALVGKVGSGKSATANCILGDDAFESKDSYRAVTETCQKRSREFHDGCATRTVNVIDTPGLFDMDSTAEDVQKEIAKCMDMAKDGFDAMLMVFSAQSRFSCEDEKAIESIKLLFGNEVLDHMILVFTHGDVVGGESRWKKKLTDSAPAYLQDMVDLFADRVVLFDNNTSDMQQREYQLKKLFRAVDFVISRNHGRPFCNQMFTQIKEMHPVSISNKEIYDDYLKQISKMVEEKLNSTIARLETQLHEEQKERQAVENSLREEIHALKDSLKKAEEEANKSSSKCIIL
uniref:AIG1-type G domain-containing protein n=2 Tax=Triticum urartu TaxID=4572 RepID=A0A8R7RBZ5_TRIUA